MKNEWLEKDDSAKLNKIVNIMVDVVKQETDRLGPKITTDDIEILEQQNMHTLAKWWCEFNSWGWPSAIPNPETQDERMSFYENNYKLGENKRSRASQIMEWIDNRIGHRVISQEWNKERMSPEEFNDFWLRREGNQGAIERDDKKTKALTDACENLAEQERRQKMKDAVDYLSMHWHEEAAELIRERLSLD